MGIFYHHPRAILRISICGRDEANWGSNVRPLKVYMRRRKGKGLACGKDEVVEDDNSFELTWQQNSGGRKKKE